MRNDGRNEKIRNKERPFGGIHPIENRFVSIVGTDSMQGTKVIVKVLKVHYCKNRGIFEAV